MKLTVLTAIFAVAVLTSCGSVRTPAESGGASALRGGSDGHQPFQPRDKFIACVREAGGDAVPVGVYTAQMLPAATAPKVVYAVNGDEATVLQVQGKAEGAELIGQALVYSSRATEEQVKLAQKCA